MDPSTTQFGQAFALAWQTAYGTKAPSGAPFGGPQSPGGFFGVSGLEQEVISARITPRGILGQIPVVPDVLVRPQFAYITGIEILAGSEPKTECETCLSGETESCIQTAQFGYICRESKTLDASKAIERIDRGQLDLRLINDIIGTQGGGLQPDISVDRVLQEATAWAMVEVGVLFQNALMPMVWQGNPANSVGTGYKEFPGLDSLISTGKVDANTLVACASLDSDVKDFNYRQVYDQAADGSYYIVRYLEAMEAYLFHNADRMNLSPVTWKLCMNGNLWQELSSIWPITYMSLRNISLQTGVQLALDAESVRRIGDDMRSNMFITINGHRYDVVTDDGVYEEQGGQAHPNTPTGMYSGPIYFVPWTYLGQRPAVFLQHKDYRAATPEYAGAHLSSYYWTDGGRYQWTAETKKWCYSISGRLEPRLILRTPQLAGKVQHVVYNPMQHFRSPWQGDVSNFRKGGVSMRDSVNDIYAAYQAR